MIKKQLGDRIRSLRKSNTGLSQEKFSYAIGLDRSYYASIERGERNVSIDLLQKIADGLGVSMSDLFEGL